MAVKNMTPDKDALEKQFQDNFEDVYLSYYPGMVRFAKKYVGSKEDAENIVHDAFAEIWETRSRYFCKINNLQAFLVTTIKNKSIDYLRRRMVVRDTEDVLQETYRRETQMKFDSLESFNEDILLFEENIDTLITKAIDALPEKCRQIFLMNKVEGKKQKEIAQELNISINTIETQMGIAYKKLKEELKGYMPLLLFIISL